jgi:hypothetical protein
MRHLWAFGPCLALSALLGSCSAQKSERGRQTSPDQKLIAVWMESLGDGTEGSVSEDIYLGDRNTPVNFDNAVFSGGGCSGLTFAWTNEYTLEIHYPTSCTIQHFTNRWYRPSDLQVGRRNPIEIILVRG